MTKKTDLALSIYNALNNRGAGLGNASVIIIQQAIEDYNKKNKECPNCGEKAGTYTLGECCNACHKEL